MKRLTLLTVLAVTIVTGYSQADTISDNIYQLDGKMGIGTTEPNALLNIVDDVADGAERALIRIKNLNTGPKSSVSISLEASEGSGGASFGWSNESYLGIPDLQNMGVFSTNRNGFAFYSTTDYGSIRFYTNVDQSGIIERMRINAQGNIGIGTKLPVELLDLNGGIKIGNTANENAGTIRWNGEEFQGYNGTGWISFTGGTSAWTPDTFGIIYRSGTVGIGSASSNNLLNLQAYVGTGIERNLLRINNTSNGSSSYTGIILKTGDGNYQSVIQDYGINYTASLPYEFGGFLNIANNSKGLMFHAGSSEGIIKFFTAGTERLRIDPEGNVGIGTKEPLNKFQVTDSGTRVQIGYQPAYKGPYVNIYGTDNGEAPMLALGVANDVYYKFNDTLAMKDWGLIYGNDGNKGIFLGTSLSYPDLGMFLHSNGRLGLGIRNPLARLDVDGGVRLGNTESEAGGVIRWTGEDFEGYNGSNWVSLSVSSTNLWTQNANGLYYFTGNVGIGTSEPESKLQVSDGDIYISDIDRGIIMKSPNGQCWRGVLDNEGSLSFSAVPCPGTPIFSEETSMESTGLIDVFPNPADESVTVRISKASGTGHSYALYLLNGNLVDAGKITDGLAQLNLRTFKENVCILQVSDRQGNIVGTKKILKN